MYYFAYGSNLDPLQMRLRCPEAKFVSTAKLDGYRICFPRKSFVRDCAVISIEPVPGEAVWGALYELDGVDIARLDERDQPRQREQQATETDREGFAQRQHRRGRAEPGRERRDLPLDPA